MARELPETASVAGFLSSLGVNTHTAWHDAAYGSANSSGSAAKVAQLLGYLGISRIRDDGLARSWMLSTDALLARSGIGLDLFVSTRPGSDTLQQQVGNLAALAPHLIGIEGPNETDLTPFSFGGSTGANATRIAQTELYDLVRRQPSLNGVPVLQSSVGHAENIPAYRRVGHADLGNIHSYFFNFDLPIAHDMPERLAQAEAVTPGRPAVTTETGWPTRGRGGDYVDEVTQAKLLLQDLFAQFKSGVRRCFIYQLMDEPDPDHPYQGDYYGLFNEHGTPKPSARAIGNLTSILSVPAPETSLDKPDDGAVSLSALPDSADSLTLRQGSGVLWVVAWNGGTIWDAVRNREVSLRPVQARVHGAGSACLYDPLVGTTPTRLAMNSSGEFAVDVPDHPILVRLGSGTCPAPKRPSAPGKAGE